MGENKKKKKRGEWRARVLRRRGRSRGTYLDFAVVEGKGETIEGSHVRRRMKVHRRRWCRLQWSTR